MKHFRIGMTITSHKFCQDYLFQYFLTTSLSQKYQRTKDLECEKKYNNFRKFNNQKPDIQNQIFRFQFFS